MLEPAANSPHRRWLGHEPDDSRRPAAARADLDLHPEHPPQQFRPAPPARHPQHALALLDARTHVGPEPRMRPPQHAARGVLVEPALAHEPGEHLAPPEFLQHRGVGWRQWDERAITPKHAVAHQHVQVRMQVGERAEGLDARDHARHRVALAEAGLDVVAQGARGDPAQQSQPAPVVEEVGAQALRERQHHLAVRDRGEQALIKPQASLGQPPRVTRRAEVSPLAAQRHQELGPAGRAAHPGEAVLEQAAIQEPAHRPARRGTPLIKLPEFWHFLTSCHSNFLPAHSNFLSTPSF